jgi:hypothetical protein
MLSSAYLEHSQSADANDGPRPPRYWLFVIRVLAHGANDCDLLILSVDGVRVDNMRVGKFRHLHVVGSELVHVDGGLEE